MILPTKGISPQRCLLTVGAEVLEVLRHPRSVSSAYEALSALRSQRGHAEPVEFDWFSLSLSMLYSIQAIDLDPSGKLVKMSLHPDRITDATD